MGFECKTIHGLNWFICHGQEPQQTFHGAAAHLLDEYGRSASGYLWGKGNGCWDALWLAERYNVRLLILEDCCPKATIKALRTLALRNLFAVVCPVLICAQDDDVLPTPPNAPVYIVNRPEQLPEAIQALI